MLIKRITCKVTNDQRNAFYEAQKQWDSLSKVSGFIGQLGGWSKEKPFTAYVYAFWENHKDYHSFMEEVHDRIYEGSGQRGTYTSIEVELFEEEGNIFGVGQGINDFLRKSEYMHFSLSTEKEEIIQHVIDLQRWNRGQDHSVGILGGTYAISHRDRTRFLMLSGWKITAIHRKDAVYDFPFKMRYGGQSDDKVEIAGECFEVEDAWRVLKR